MVIVEGNGFFFFFDSRFSKQQFFDLLGVTGTNIGETDGLKNGLELVKSVSDKHLDLLRPSARYSISKGNEPSSCFFPSQKLDQHHPYLLVSFSIC